MFDDTCTSVNRVLSPHTEASSVHVIAEIFSAENLRMKNVSRNCTEDKKEFVKRTLNEIS